MVVNDQNFKAGGAFFSAIKTKKNLTTTQHKGIPSTRFSVEPKILHMGFHSLTLCEDVDLTAFGSVQRPVLYNYQYLFAWENIPGLIHLYSHLFHAVQANMDRANRQ